MSRILRGIVAAVVLVGLAVASVIFANSMQSKDAYGGTTCERVVLALRDVDGNLATTLDGPKKEDLLKTDGALRAELKDHGCVIDEYDNLIGDPEKKLVPSAAPSTGSTPAPTTNPSGTTKDKDDKSSKSKENADTWKPHYYTLDKGKRGDLDFGPGVKGGKQAVDGTKAEKAKALKAIRKEWWTRLTNDPALAAGNGGLILHGKDGGKKQVDELLKSKSARDKYIARVKGEIKSTRVEKRYAQTVESAVMVVPKDGVPRIVKLTTYRYEAYYVFVVKTKHGKTYNFRLECGFQWDTGRKIVPQKYVPVQHTPYTPIRQCVVGSRDSNGMCGHNTPPSHHTPPQKGGGCTSGCGHTTPPKCTSGCGHTLTPKDPSQDPAQRGNAGNGGGKNANPGPGATTKPVRPPSTPRENPAPPATGGGSDDSGGDSDDGGSKPAPPKESAAPGKDNPAEGCDPPPGRDSC